MHFLINAYHDKLDTSLHAYMIHNNLFAYLKKGQKVDLTKGNPGLSKIMVGLGWDVNRYDGGHDFDLDASAFLQGLQN